MKKILSLTLALLMCLTTVALLASCSHEHVYSADWSADDTNHWHACTEKDDCEEKADLAAHTFGTPEYKDGKRIKTCTVCEKAVSEDYNAEIADEDWAAAFNVDHDNYTAICANKEGDTVEYDYNYKDGYKYQYRSGEGEDLYEYFCDFDGEKYWRYTYNPGLEVWQKEEIEEGHYNSAVSEDLSFAFPADKFTYDAASKSYKGEEYTLEIGGGNFITVSDAVVMFADGKLIYLSVTQTMGEDSMTMSYTFTYGTAEVTLPVVAE